MIDWNSTETHIFLNPRMPASESQFIKEHLSSLDLPSHIWLTTSGTTGKYKCVALSKRAFIKSAEAVNRFFGISSEDIWLQALPEFHVGGLGIYARSFLSKSQVIKLPAWDPCVFTQLANRHSVTISALVPTQLYDLTKQDAKAPQSFRYTIVGGGALDKTLFEKSWSLGWNAVSSYGMTECASQIATAKPGTYDRYTPLEHVKIRADNQGKIEINSKALLTGYMIPKSNGMEWMDPKSNNWFKTSDKGMLENGFLKIFGRDQDMIKINGELINLCFLRNIISELKYSLSIINDLALIPVPSARSGYKLVLVCENGQKNISALKNEFNSKVMPFERIESIKYIQKIPRTPIGKISTEKLIEQLCR